MNAVSSGISAMAMVTVLVTVSQAGLPLGEVARPAALELFLVGISYVTLYGVGRWLSVALWKTAVSGQDTAVFSGQTIG